MMNIDTIGIGANTREVKNASRDLDRLGASADKASRKADRTTRATENLGRGAKTAAGQFSALGRVIGVFAIADLTRRTFAASDAFTKFNAQLKQATTSQKEFNEAQANVVRIARTAQASVGAIGTVYARFTNALRENGAEQKTIAAVTETLSLALKVNGATSEETSSAMLQLSQAFGKGKLDGDEFRTAMEAMPNVMRDLAKSMGVPFGALKDLAQQGAITSEELLKAFSNPELLNAYRINAKETETIAGAWQNVKNALTLAIGKATEFIGLTSRLNEASSLFTQAFSEGGLFGGQTQGRRKSEAQKEIYQLQSMLAGGDTALALGGTSKTAIRKRIAALRKEFFRAEGFGNSIASGGIDGNTGAPSFETPVYAQDVRELRKRDERIQKQHEEQLRLAKDRSEENERLEARRYEEEIRLATEAREWAAQQEKEQHETEMKWLELRQNQANKNFKAAQDAHNKFEQDRRRDYERTGDILSRSLTDALFRGFESGKSFVENFIDTLKNTFRTLVLQPLVRFAVDASGITGVLGALGGVFSGNAQAGALGTGPNSITGLLGDIKGLFQGGNDSFIGAINDFGAFLANGKGGILDTIGGAIGQYSSQIANVLPYAGAALSLLSGDIKGAAFSGGGVALGSFFGGPIGGAIGGVIGKVVGGLFGGSKQPPRQGGNNRTFLSADGFLSNRFLGGVEDYSGAVQGSITGATQYVASALKLLNDGFGGNDNVSVQARYFGRDGGSSYQDFDARVGGARYRVPLYRNKDQFGGADFKNFLARVQGEFLSNTIQRLDLPKGVKSFFAGLRTGIAETIQSLVSMQNALKDLPTVFDSIRNVLDKNTFGIKLNELQAQFQATQQFYSLFYSEAEQFDVFTNQIIRSLSELNLALPTSRDEYRKLVETFDVVDQATFNQKTALASLAPQMAQYFDYLEKQSDAFRNLDASLFSTYADYVSAQANGENYADFIYKAQSPTAMNQVLIDEVKMLRQKIAEGEATNKVILEAIAKHTQTSADIAEKQEYTAA